MRARSILAAAAAAVVLAGTVGCGRSHNGPLSITVFAAASLKETFTDIAQRFEADNPGTSVNLEFAGSSDLVAQLKRGAVADVFAAGDTNTMNDATRAGLLAEVPIDFASNTLAIVVAKHNPQGIGSFTDLNRPGLAVAVCAPVVPCGAAAERIEDSTGVRLHPVSQESSVTDVLAKVISGQADAGLVYITDALGAGDAVAMVPFTQSVGAVNTYSIAVLRDSKHPGLANRFIALVTGDPGRNILTRAGFTKPT